MSHDSCLQDPLTYMLQRDSDVAENMNIVPPQESSQPHRESLLQREKHITGKQVIPIRDCSKVLQERLIPTNTQM